MFKFFYLVNRSGIIDFCGTTTNQIVFDLNGLDSRECFRLHEDGFYKGGKPMITKQPNILKSVLIGKKGIGLWFDQWSDGIVDWSFTKEEILQEFIDKGVEIPEPLMIEWDKLITKLKIIRNDNYLNELKKNKK